MSKLHGKNTRVYVDGVDISGDANSFEPGYSADVADVSGFAQDSKSYVVGLADTATRIAAVFNDGSAGVHALGSSLVGEEVMLSAVWGTDAGRQGVGGTLNLSEYSVSAPISGAVTANMSLAGGAGDSGVFEYTRTIQGKSALAADPGGYDNSGNESNAGAGVHLQLFSGTGTVVFQTSPDDAAWTTRVNFGLQTAPYGAYLGTYTGTMATYLRMACPAGTGTAYMGFKKF